MPTSKLPIDFGTIFKDEDWNIEEWFLPLPDDDAWYLIRTTHNKYEFCHYGYCQTVKMLRGTPVPSGMSREFYRNNVSFRVTHWIPLGRAFCPKPLRWWKKMLKWILRN